MVVASQQPLDSNYLDPKEYHSVPSEGLARIDEQGPFDGARGRHRSEPDGPRSAYRGTRALARVEAGERPRGPFGVGDGPAGDEPVDRVLVEVLPSSSTKSSTTPGSRGTPAGDSARAVVCMPWLSPRPTIRCVSCASTTASGRPRVVVDSSLSPAEEAARPTPMPPSPRRMRLPGRRRRSG